MKSQIAPSQIPNPQSSIPNRPRRVHPILSRLTPDQKQQLILLYEQNSSLDAVRLAHEKLGIQISSGTLSRLYSIWQIAQDNDTRHDLEAAHNSSIEQLTEKQLQLRLLEQASRPNMDHTELRAICQSYARLQSVKLSARRVQIAESKEARLAQNAESDRDFSVEETTRGIRAMMGKPTDDDDDCDYSAENQNCRRRDDESLTNSAPETPSNPNPSSNSDEAGHVAPRAPQADETLPNNQNASSVTAPQPEIEISAQGTNHSLNENCSLPNAHCSITPSPNPVSSALSANSVSIPFPCENPPLSLPPLPNQPPTLTPKNDFQGNP